MKIQLLKYLFAATLFVAGSFVATGCKSYCPGTDGTGNSASRSTKRSIRLGKSHCPAVAGTGNQKPKMKRRKPEDGLVSKKMARQMAKADKKKAGPIEAKKLSFD